MSFFNKNKKEIDINEAFAKNLKYISQTQIKIKDIENQFVKTQSRYYLTVGYIDCPTGRIVVSDPLCYLYAGNNNEFCSELEIQVPIGNYPVEVSIFRNDEIGIRMCTARLKIKDSKPKKYVLAESTVENNNSSSKKSDLSGFLVDAGMMSFCDVQVADEYRKFLDNWHKHNENKNHYDDYFADYFAKSSEKLPQFQRELGDFIEWINPDSQNKMVMIASGFGDGFYQSYWGYDKDGEICELIVPMINPDLFEK